MFAMSTPTSTPTSAARLRLGPWQFEMFEKLLERGVLVSPLGKLRGGSYARYRASLEALIRKMRAVGYQVEIESGPRGGWHAAAIRLVGWPGRGVLVEVTRPRQDPRPRRYAAGRVVLGWFESSHDPHDSRVKGGGP